MEILGGLLALLVVLAVPFVLPIVAWVSARRTRTRVETLEALASQQERELDELRGRLNALAIAAGTQESAQAPPRAKAADVSGPAPEPVRPTAVLPKPELPKPVPPAPVVSKPDLPRPVPPPPVVPKPVAPAPVVSAPILQRQAAEQIPPAPPSRPLPPPPPPAPPEPPPPAPAPFDWENLVGVKLFSAIAGIALVLAAIFFLRYAAEAGWLQPPVRVAIGIIVAIGLLVACELKAARRYPATANALDAAAIAILFATFFAAHALWNLIPAFLTFGLLALVTALAVILSIRRESLFIAVLGLLGGFSTPALLSTGENRPIPLFAYLLLLNVGLAWVAYQKKWPVLTWLTLILTTIYQWGWVFRFLDSTSLPLAMGVFIVFPLVSLTLLILRRTPDPQGPPESRAFERSALISAAVPVLFAVYLATVPQYGARPGLLFGFLLLVDLGLLAIAIARRQELMHAAGAIATMLTVVIWMSVSYLSDARFIVLSFTTAFVALYLFAPALAERFARRFTAVGNSTARTAPLLLFVFPVLAGIEPAFEAPWLLFTWLLGVVLLIAARATLARDGTLYFLAAFFAVGAQAVWSAMHLTIDRLGAAVAIYTLFGIVMLAVPVAARRMQRPLEPVWGGGAVLIASLLLLMFIAAGDVAPAALWAMALLLAILNAALFIESAAGGLPIISQVGSILSWIVLATWWSRAAASVGVIPSLTVLTGLALITLGGHAFSVISLSRAGESEDPKGFSNGLYLALVGHFFLMWLAMNREWAIPPWPLFGSLAVMTLATSAASLVTRNPALHAAGAVAASTVIAAWSSAAAPAPYGLVALVAGAVAAAYAIGWIRLVPPDSERTAAAGAALSLFIAEVSALVAVASGGSPPFLAVVVAHVANVAAILWLTWRHGWKHVPLAAVAAAWLAVFQWQELLRTDHPWYESLIFAAALYATFVAYPLVLGRRASAERDPYLAAVLASVMFFFSARSAFLAGDLAWMIGVVPVATGGVLALLLRQLLRIQPSGERDLGRLALVAGAALACVTVAIPLQLEEQWITIGWALEGAALAWLYRRIPHRGLLYVAVALLATVFVRLAMNPEVLSYEPRGSMRILNWYLYTYLLAAVTMFVAGWWLSKTNDELVSPLPRPSQVFPAAGVILLFLLLNIEIADFYATGPAVTFRFGVTVSQDLTYTIGWLAFGMALLAAGIYLGNRQARVAAVSLIAVTTFKCFLYDLRSLEGLYRVASFVGLALSLALVSMALQKYVLSKSRGTA